MQHFVLGTRFPRSFDFPSLLSLLASSLPAEELVSALVLVVAQVQVLVQVGEPGVGHHRQEEVDVAADRRHHQGEEVVAVSHRHHQEEEVAANLNHHLNRHYRCQKGEVVCHHRLFSFYHAVAIQPPAQFRSNSRESRVPPVRIE